MMSLGVIQRIPRQLLTRRYSPSRPKIRPVRISVTLRKVILSALMYFNSDDMWKLFRQNRTVETFFLDVGPSDLYGSPIDSAANAHFEMT